MTPGEVLAAVTRRGVSVSVEGDRLFVDPVSSITDDERAVLRDQKRAVVAFLRLLGTASPSDEQAVADLIAETEGCGAVLYLRAHLGLVIKHGERISDDLLIRLVKAHDKIERAIRADDGLFSLVVSSSNEPVAVEGALNAVRGGNPKPQKFPPTANFPVFDAWRP
jgi:hypothetical protein